MNQIPNPKPQVPSKPQAAQDLDELTANPVPSMADDVEEYEEKQWDPQAMYNAGGHFKEQLEVAAGRIRKERVIEEVEEVPAEPEVEPKLEREGWIEKVEKEAELGQAGTDDYVGQVLMGSANPQNPKVTIPLTDDQITQGLHHKVWEAIRWLAVWCIRQMKKLGMPIPVKTKK
ncbi:hypothetical protein A2634_02095 [Candidatus Amesbacteria bacterium RIFCSPHIGHO2_01_FULL_48_32]|uniref:Uncharacterized protein n=1 Tax=Candidatus Amesbacteria bacterium RIFCSPLOWO2_01_FULL_48_25 TaxID=1797259 RepID=A0A1F4ZDB3_9BACT|nr:MAG: hypothetical protein A2634_02095 [Candidatus Amesbacteria bacterium RIFCSPHIGHO2_01_FULL_48_32]OGD04379.1 MAG: hypothetical protein A2989_05095 [Candidatus Amesbacteria bacterium RIFCSPLOWO2_01_FULL_48_25]HJZ06216.1 hypothetical protein [Patescibacteria group bacterium]